VSALYVESSCLGRILFNRPGERVPFNGHDLLITSEVTRIELARTIELARLRGSIADLESARLRRALTDALQRMTLFPVADEIVQLASAPFGAAVPALAGLHAATAQVVRDEAPDLVFWTHDVERATAALARGLPTAGLSTRA
jgi:hypothetical protein